tara:strand:- start:7046 stop:7792 length:747 start_codon:yes stop_codon:yes gene_type:complete
MADKQYHSEIIDLPSKGKVYGKDSPLKDGKIELKYMTAKEEDILTSQNLIKKGVVVDKVLDSLILTEGVKTNDLIIGDKNAVMVAARILAYGPEYTAEVTNPNTGETAVHTFNLADCPFKEISEDITGNTFDMELPVSKTKIKFRLLTGKDEKEIENEIKQQNKLGSQVSPELTTRLRKVITEVDGDSEQSTINQFVNNMLSRDSLFFRQSISKVSPDIDLTQEVEIGGDVVRVDIPMTINFFWPDAS